jgi:hypothetical protein
MRHPNRKPVRARGARRARALWVSNAALDARITRRHLASYLGVTAEHLSRLRQRVTLPRQQAAPPGVAAVQATTRRMRSSAIGMTTACARARRAALMIVNACRAR